MINFPILSELRTKITQTGSSLKKFHRNKENMMLRGEGQRWAALLNFLFPLKLTMK